MDVEGEEGQVCNQMAEKQLESAITVYLRRVCHYQDITPMMKVIVELQWLTARMVFGFLYIVVFHIISNLQLLMSQLDAKYFNHPVYMEAKSLPPFMGYMEECVKVAWGLCIQTPHMIISCKDTVYNPDLHNRFYNADRNMVDILMYMWPVLTQMNGPVLVRGIVLT